MSKGKKLLGMKGQRRKGQSSSDTGKDDSQDEANSLATSNGAKDKTQIASTTSMAVIHIGILKGLLDLGPAVLPYYYWCIGFVVAALALQFLSGVIAIYIATMQSFLSEFKYDFNYYCKRWFCPCIFDSKSKVDLTRQELGDISDLISEQGDETGCCLSCKKSKDEVEYEEVLLETYFNWISESFQMEIRTANIVEDIASVEEFIEDLEDARTTTLDEVTDSKHPRIEDIDKRIDQQQTYLETLKKLQHDYHTLRRKGIVLKKQLKIVLNQKVMKKAAFWQCILTILTYVIFALNAVITGFGLSNLSKPG